MRQHCQIVSIISLCMIVMAACSRGKIEEPSAKDPTQWRTELQKLNCKYAQKIDAQRNRGFAYMPQRCMDVDGWEVAYWDVIGFTRGLNLGKYFGPYGPLVGGILIGGGLSAMSYFAQRNGYIVTNNIENMTASEFIQWMFNNGPNPINSDFELLIDSRDPINLWEDWHCVMNNAIGVEAGPMHNYIVTRLLTDSTYSNQDLYDKETLMDAIFNIMNDSHMIPDTQAHNACESAATTFIQNDWINSLNIDEELCEIEEQLVDIGEFLGIAFCLDSALLYEYADAYTTIVDNAWQSGYISSDDALLINATISVGCYSHMMWRKYLENEVSTNLRIGFDTQNNVVYCSKEEAAMLTASSTIQFVGIPHFVHNRLAEIYFYGIAGDDYVLPDIENLIINYGTSYTISNDVLYLSDYSNIHLQSGHYPIYTLPHSNNIRYIKTYDFIDN